MSDPDAPSGLWYHWVMWNIEPSTTAIAENSLPPGAMQGANSWGKRSYGGPCPPSGTHRYFFRLYALSSKIELAPSASGKSLSRRSGHDSGDGGIYGDLLEALTAEADAIERG